MSDAATSGFWQELGEAHARQVDAIGMNSVKRVQALRYFTWSWRWRDLPHSVQMRFLLRHVPPATVLRVLLTPAKLARVSWHGITWRRHDRWLYAFAVRLLWRYAQTQDATGTLRLPEPALGSPMPVRLDGRLISQDLANCALENRVMLLGLASPPNTVLEIGSGYGRTAYTLLSLHPQLTYTVVDVRPALDISRWYLGSLFPADRVSFVHATDVDTLATGSIDLAVSISALHNLTADEVRAYLELLDRIVRPGGRVYANERRDWYNPVDRERSTFSSYPIPDRWQLVHEQQAPVQTDFVEAVWQVGTTDE
jgi:SAM-dependent methyltransferase